MAVLVQTALNQYVTKTNLAAAVAATDSANRTIVVTGAETVSASLTIPATRTLRVEKGATITVASGQTLTLNCPIDAGRYAIFAGTGTIAGLQKAYPEWWVTNTTPGTTAMQAAFTSALAACDVVDGEGTYALADTVTLGDGKILSGNMTLKAITGLANKPVLMIKEGDGTSPAWGVTIPESVIIDGNDIALTGVEVYYGRDCRINPAKITRVCQYGVLVGDAAASTSTDVHMLGTTVWYHESGTPVSKGGSYANPADSIGVYYRNCTDSHVMNVTSIGFRVGFQDASTAGAINYLMCHAWNRRAHGPLLAAFRSYGSTGGYVRCHADTPHNWYSADGSTYTQDATITAVYGWYIDSYSQALVNCKIYMNPSETYGATDNLLTACHFAKAEYGFIFGLQVQGGHASYRYAYLYGGTTTNATLVGTGIPTSGTLVNTTSAFDQVGVNTLKYTSDKIAIDDAAATAREMAIKTAGVARWYVGANTTEESGANAGSDFNIRCRADDGGVLYIPLTITRSTGNVTLACVPVYADNAAAISGGLAAGALYRTSVGDLRIVYTP